MQIAPRMRSHGANRKLDIAAIAGVVIAGVLLAPTAASADSPDTGNATKVSIVGADALGAAVRRADEIQADAAPVLKSRADGHLDRAARAGKLIDTRRVKVAAIADPNIAGREIHLVWDEGKVPRQITVENVESTDGISRGFGSIFVDDTSVESTDLRPTGSGYDAAGGKNMYKYKNGCIEQWWDQQTGSTKSHYLWACWEKWKQSGTNKHWIYNRWGRFSRADTEGKYYSPRTKEVTLRSRPWSGNDQLASLNSASPTASALTCEEIATVNFGYNYSGTSVGISLPLHRCNDVHPVGVWSRREIGVQFQGEYTGKVMYVDMAGDYTSKETYSAPVWADYAWVGVDECYSGFTGFCRYSEYTRKDSGW